MFKHILVAVDGSECAAKALDAAASLAKALGAQCTACTVVDIIRAASSMTIASADVVQTYFEALREDAKHVLQQAAERARAAGVSIDTQIVEGYPAEDIVAFGKKCNADLIVMGSHGRTGIQRLLLGSVAEAVVRSAPVPVLVVRL